MDASQARRVTIGVLIVACVCVFIILPAIAGSSFTWSGGGTDGNWTTVANWGTVSVYPGQTATDDKVTIDHPSPRPVVVQDKTSLTIGELFIGDGHDVQLDQSITVASTAGVTGGVRFEGAVDIVDGGNGLKQILAEWAMVYAARATAVYTDTDTKITTD